MWPQATTASVPTTSRGSPSGLTTNSRGSKPSGWTPPARRSHTRQLGAEPGLRPRPHVPTCSSRDSALDLDLDHAVLSDPRRWHKCGRGERPTEVRTRSSLPVPRRLSRWRAERSTVDRVGRGANSFSIFVKRELDVSLVAEGRLRGRREQIELEVDDPDSLGRRDRPEISESRFQPTRHLRRARPC
jgi:hypothetical protein